MKGKLKLIRQQLSFRKKSRKSILLSVVALIEILAIMVVSTYAWIETASTIIIQSNGEQKIDSYVYTNAEISKDTKNTINLSKYFRASGNVHLASAASANGKDYFFPRVASTASNNSFRQGNINDKNTNYISFSFKVTAQGTDAKFIFGAVPTITIGGRAVPENAVRVAIDDGTTTRIFSDKAKSENVTINGATSVTNILAFKDYADGTVANETSRVLTVDAHHTKIVTVTLWLHDPNRQIGDDNAKVSVSDLELILDTSQTTSVYFDDKTSRYNAPGTNGWGWVGNNGAKLWVYDGVANTLREMKRESALGNIWTGTVEKASFDNTSTGNNLVFYNCAADVTRENVRSNYICKWETNFAQAKKVNPTNRLYTACGYYRNTGTKTGMGTWGSVAMISLDPGDANVLSRPSNPDSATHVYFKDNVSNISYQMNYRRDDSGTYYWQAYVPSTVNFLIFHMTVNSTNYTINASHRDTAEVSSKFVLTSPKTGYWDPPAIVTVVLVSGCEDMGTVSVSGGPENATTVKVTKGVSVSLDAVAASDQYGFKGWYNNSSCTGTPQPNHYSFTPTESNKEYKWYAKFLPQHRVSLKAISDNKCPDSTGGTVQIKISDTEHTSATAEEDLYVLDGGSVTIVAAPKASHNFLGWFDNNAQTAVPVYDSTNRTKTLSNIKGDVLLYAKYAIKTFKIEAQAKTEDSTDNDKGGTVKFGNDSQADSKDYVTTTVNYNGSVTFRAYVKNTDAYAFAGWYTDEACTKLENSTNPYTVTNIKANKKLYARFNLKRYDITAHAVSNGVLNSSTYGTVCKVVSGTAQTPGATATAAQAKHGSTVTFRAAEKTGSAFEGWFSNSACTARITTGLSGTGNKDLTITVPNYTNVYAKFTPVSHTVKAIAGSNGQVKVNSKALTTGTSTDTVVDGSTATFYAQPTDSINYQFAGWYTGANGTGTRVSQSATYTINNVTKDYTYYAHFTAVPKIKYYFQNTSNWATPMAYTYRDSDDALGNGAWGAQSTKMTKVSGTARTYSIEVPSTCDMVVFNNNGGNGSNQTADIQLPKTAGKVYVNKDSKWIDYTGPYRTIYVYANGYENGLPNWYWNDSCVPAIRPAGSSSATITHSSVTNGYWCFNTCPYDAYDIYCYRHNSSGDYNSVGLGTPGDNVNAIAINYSNGNFSHGSWYVKP